MNAFSSFARPADLFCSFSLVFCCPHRPMRSSFPSARPPSACRRMWAPTRQPRPCESSNAGNRPIKWRGRLCRMRAGSVYRRLPA